MNFVIRSVLQFYLYFTTDSKLKKSGLIYSLMDNISLLEALILLGVVVKLRFVVWCKLGQLAAFV
jgi:hypothetical protein